MGDWAGQRKVRTWLSPTVGLSIAILKKKPQTMMTDLRCNEIKTTDKKKLYILDGK